LCLLGDQLRVVIRITNSWDNTIAGGAVANTQDLSEIDVVVTDRQVSALGRESGPSCRTRDRDCMRVPDHLIPQGSSVSSLQAPPFVTRMAR
jgi:hypothetical protein